jgi:hypothetical protein
VLKHSLTHCHIDSFESLQQPHCFTWATKLNLGMKVNRFFFHKWRSPLQIMRTTFRNLYQPRSVGNHWLSISRFSYDRGLKQKHPPYSWVWKSEIDWLRQLITCPFQSICRQSKLCGR